MSKKIVAVTLLFAVIFTCVFTACGKKNEDETGVYIDPDKYDFVTDEDGSRVYNKDGEFLVYATEENGKRVTNADEEEQTLARPFEPIEEKDKYETYSYAFSLPKGWKATNIVGDFENPKKGQKIFIRILNETYNDYYDKNYEDFEELKGTEGISVTWEENVTLNENCSKVYRFTLSSEEGARVMYVFLNAGNLYKVIFETPDAANAISDSLEICDAISYKPYAYEPDVASANLAKETEGPDSIKDSADVTESTTASTEGTTTK